MKMRKTLALLIALMMALQSLVVTAEELPIVNGGDILFIEEAAGLEPFDALGEEDALALPALSEGLLPEEPEAPEPSEEETPVEESPIEEEPVEEGPVEEEPVEETPVEEAPVEETPVEEAPDVPTLEEELPVAEEAEEARPARPVTVVFNTFPADAAVSVWTLPAEEPVPPQEDGSFALLPGAYTYSASAAGYIPQEGVPFTVGDAPLVIEIQLEMDLAVESLELSLEPLFEAAAPRGAGISMTGPADNAPGPNLDYAIVLTGVASDTIEITGTFDTDLFELASAEPDDTIDHLYIWGGDESSQAEGKTPVSASATQTGILLTANTIPRQAGESYYPCYRLTYTLKPREGVDLRQRAADSVDGEIAVQNTAVFDGAETSCSFRVQAEALKNVSYVEADGRRKTAEVCLPAIRNMDGAGDSAGWYALTRDKSFTERVTVSGDVKLILCDGATLTASQGITVQGDARLTIYAQRLQDGKDDSEKLGALVATGSWEAAGIGTVSKGTGGVTVVNGGRITATGGSNGAGIGGGAYSSGFQVTVNSGYVTATGGSNGAGLGGGSYAKDFGVTVNGGDVEAEGQIHAAGIGGAMSGSAGRIEITGGRVNASGGSVGTGIGGSYECHGGSIRITGGEVTAIGTGEGQYAGIGGGNRSTIDAITISGGTVDARGSWSGAGIGSMSDNSSIGAITIGGSARVTATGGVGGGSGAGIGNVKKDGTFSIDRRAVVNARSDGYGPGIGVSPNGAPLTVGGSATVTATGGTLQDSTVTGGAGIGGHGGSNSAYAGSCGSVILRGNAVVTATGGIGAAGIGGGRMVVPKLGDGKGGAVTVSGHATLTATAGNAQAAAIGWGEGCTAEDKAGTLALYDAAMVRAGASETDSNPVEYRAETQPDPRLTACQGSVYAKVMPCKHLEGQCEIISQTQHQVTCMYCAIEQGTHDHVFLPSEADDPDAKVRVCACGAMIASYIDTKGEAQPPRFCLPASWQMDGSAVSDLFDGGSAWYAATGVSALNTRVNVKGDVNLILCDDATFKADAGVEVAKNNSLTVWAQSEGSARGALIAQPSNSKFENLAGIGGGETPNAGTITLNGGTIRASGVRRGAGIGGGKDGNGGTITIDGATSVTARGQGGGAGIGGGAGGSGEAIIIQGRSVIEEAASSTDMVYGGAGIGGGWNGNGGTITIDGATVRNAHGDDSGAGIGGGYDKDGSTGTRGESGIITIKNGANVTATGGKNAASIGGGESGKGIRITIEGSTIKVNGVSSSRGAGIGGGSDRNCGEISIIDSNLNVNGGYAGGAGIGNGAGSSVSGGKVTISGSSTIVAYGAAGGAIGGGEDNQANSVSIDGDARVVASSSSNAGINALKIQLGGNCNIEANGGSSSAGIGSSEDCSGVTVTITGGRIRATGGQWGAGIGSGCRWNAQGPELNGGTITISGEDTLVIANGGEKGAGIGGGWEVSGGTVKILGGVVIATARDNAQAIGRGDPESSPVALSEGTLDLYKTAKVTAGAEAGSATLALVNQRVEASRNSYADIRPCDHPNGGYTIASATQHEINCPYCEIPKGLYDHVFLPSKADDPDAGVHACACGLLQVDYLDNDGQRATHLCLPLTGEMNGANTITDGWYAATGTNPPQGGVAVAGNAKLVLPDGTATAVDGGISGATLTVYGQGGNEGVLKADGADRGFSLEQLTVYGGRVTGSGNQCGIYTQRGATLAGGVIGATASAGGGVGICAAEGAITLDWRYDGEGGVPVLPEIRATGYSGAVKLAKAFGVKGGQVAFAPTDSMDVALLAGKALIPFDIADCEARIDHCCYPTLEDAVAAARADDTVILLKDVATEGPIGIGLSLTLDLDGRTVDRGLTEATPDGNVITVSGGGSLTLADSAGGGRITGGCNRENGGGVVVANGGAFAMKGGSITGNATLGAGGGVYAAGAFSVSGAARVTGNHSLAQAQSCPSNVHLPRNRAIEVTGALAGASIGVTTEAVPGPEDGLVAFTRGLKEKGDVTDPASVFSGDLEARQGSAVAWNAGEAEAVLGLVMAVEARGYEAAYDGQAHGIDVAPGAGVAGASITYSESAEGAYVEALSYTDVCEKTVYYAVEARGYFPVTGTAGVKITRRPVTIAAKRQTVALNEAIRSGADWAGISAQTPLAGGHRLAAITLTADTGAVTASGAIVPSAASIEDGNGQDVTANYAPGYENGALTVTRGTPVPDGSLSASPITYRQALKDSVLSGSMKDACTGAGVAGSFAWAVPDAKPNVADSGRTAYRVVFTPTQSDSYAAVALEATLRVDPAPVTLTANSATVTYNGRAQAAGGFTASVTGLSFPGVSASGSGTGAGDYGVTFSGAAAGSTTDATGNYLVDRLVPGQLKITPAAVTITADDKASPYGEALQALTYAVGGAYVQGDNLGVKLSTPATAQSDVGAYPITVDWNGNPNYAATLQAGVYTVTKGDLTVSASGYSGAYDAQSHGIRVEAKGAEVYYGLKELTATNYATEGTKDPILRRDAGKTVVYYYAVAENYEAVGGSKTIDIQARKLTVTARALSKYAGQKDPKLTYTVTGLAQGDKRSQVLTGALTRQRGETPGAYAIKRGTLKASANYALSFKGAKLTIKARPARPDATTYAIARTTGTAITLSWKKVSGAQGYDVFFKKCDGNGKYPIVKTVKGLSCTLKSLEKGQAYKGYVKAWKRVDGKKTYIGTASPTVHCIVGGYSDKYCNARKVALSTPASITLKKGSSRTIKASIAGVRADREALRHDRLARYFSSDRNVATVNAQGVVKAVAPGRCEICVMANNGVKATVRVDVK